MQRPVFDDKDGEILVSRVAEWNKKTGPRVGDYIIMRNGVYCRFTYRWDNGMQTTCVNQEFARDASFYLSEDGCVDFSGSLDPIVPFNDIIETTEKRSGRFWFFHHNHVRAHNGVHVSVECRVYRQR